MKAKEIISKAIEAVGKIPDMERSYFVEVAMNVTGCNNEAAEKAADEFFKQ